tara:strand:- start:578 stop:1693 length:1116 start_codon:yes stop_codon:yes gene_type:complete
MQFQIKRDILIKSLSVAHNIIERKSTLPILGNVLLETKNNVLTIIATDLDLLFRDEISDLKIEQEGSTTTSATVLYDLLRKLPSNLDVNFDLKDGNKLKITAKNSKFNLLCLPTDDFPNFSNNFQNKPFELDGKKFLSLLNKTKISMSNDDTRHYLNGIFIHPTASNKNTYLTGVATDTHRLSSSSMQIQNITKFKPFILPKKTVFQLCNLLQESSENLSLCLGETKIQFKMGNSIIVSKVIDGKFPDYEKVVPKNNNKILNIKAKDFINSIERVITVSIDRKEGVKMTLDKDSIQLFVTSSSSGEGNETLAAKYSSETLTINFNARYLLDIASEIDDENLIMNLNDAVSPVLIQDKADNESYYVIMPMKI